MTADGVELVIRRAIGGDPAAIASILAHADTTTETAVIVMAALVERRSSRLHSGPMRASTSRDRQLVAIAQAHLDGDNELVDALARDHLVDYPDSLIVAWIASGAVGHRPPGSPVTAES
jgi:hypothetical protein